VGLGLRVCGSGMWALWVRGLGIWVHGFRWVCGLGMWVRGSGSTVVNVWFWVQLYHCR
jgi:hypothetical protein